MTQEEFNQSIEQLIEQGDKKKLVKFLKEAPVSIRLKASKFVKKRHAYYTEFVSKDNKSYSFRGNSDQLTALNYAAIACMDYKDFSTIWIHDGYFFTDTFKWYIPDWLAKYVNNKKGNNFSLKEPFSRYTELLRMQNEGYFKEPLDDEIWAKSLLFKPNINDLEKNKEALQKHVWYLFENESNIVWGQNVDVDGKKVDEWYFIFKQLTDRGILERADVMKAALKASNQNFKQNLLAWYMGLVVYLAPTADELVEIQEEILTTLSSHVSKVVNTGLDLAILMGKDQRIIIERCLEGLEIVFSSHVKSVLTKAIRLVTLLEKNFPNHHHELAMLLVTGFQMQDQGIQSKLAKLTIELSLPTNELQEQLVIYNDLLLSETKVILADYLTEAVEENLSETFQFSTIELVQIDEVETVEDLIFALASAFDRTDDYVFEQLVDAVVRLSPNFTEEHLAQLSPAFSRTYKILNSPWGVNLNVVMFALWFFEYGYILRKNSRINTETLDQIHQKEVKKSASKEFNAIDWTKPSLLKHKDFTHFTKAGKSFLPIYLHSSLMLKNKKQFPILCVPTSEPFYLDAVVLVDRLVIYQQNNYEVNAIDLQIALARIHQSTKEKGLIAAKEKLTGEFQKLFIFFLGNETEPEASEELMDVWRFAAFIKKPIKQWDSLTTTEWSTEMQDYCAGKIENWMFVREESSYRDYDYKTKTYLDKKYYHNKVELKEVEVKDLSRISSGDDRLLKSLKDSTSPDSVNLAELIISQLSDRRSTSFDVLLSMNPSLPEPVLNALIKTCLNYGGSSAYESEEKKMLLTTLEKLLIMDVDHSENFYLLLALSFLTQEKTARSFASEIWIQKLIMLNQHQLGQIIGKIEKHEFVTIKRFTDTIQSFMLNISVQHNQALEQLITSFLEQMDNKPIKGLKTLLEIYTEVIHINKSRVENKTVLDLLECWSKIASTKKAALALLKF